MKIAVKNNFSQRPYLSKNFKKTRMANSIKTNHYSLISYREHVKEKKTINILSI